MDKYDGINRPMTAVSRSAIIDGVSFKPTVQNSVDMFSEQNEQESDYEWESMFRGDYGYMPVREREEGNARISRPSSAPQRAARTDGTGALERDTEPQAPAPAEPKRRSRIASFILRGAIAALLLGFLFLPRFYPYSGSEKVTEIAKTVVMTDITHNESIGEGKLVDIIRNFFENDKKQNGDEKDNGGAQEQEQKNKTTA